MEHKPSQEPGTNTTQNAPDIPKPRGNNPDATTPQTVAETESHCAVDPQALQNDIDEKRIRLGAQAVETFRNMRTKLDEFLEN